MDRLTRRETLAGLAAVQVGPQEPLDIVDGAVTGDLETAGLAAEAGVLAQPAAEVDLEALLAVDDRALQADVGGLKPRVGRRGTPA